MDAVFAAPPWLHGAHAQTVGARLLRRRGGVALKRERLTTPDGDFLDLDWSVIHEAVPAAGPLVLVLHGLEGSATSAYALETYRQLAVRGVAAVGLNFRSCSGELNRGPRLYHSGETQDLRFVLGHVTKRSPSRPVGAIGFSLGGNVLLKFLGEEALAGRRVALIAAAAVSVPYDLAAGARHTETGLARAYVWRLLWSLRRKVRARARDLGDRMDVRAALAAKTFRAFDDAATAPLHGFHDASDYYVRSSSGQFLAHISVPTCLIQARDDPFLPAEAIPMDTIRANPILQPAISDNGGHVGFVTGTPWGPRFWAEARAATFVATRLRSPQYISRALHTPIL
jgi:predicted alpha/beta-fold hydrolase